MIGKIIAGSSFGATVGYVMKEQSRILSFKGIEPPNVQDMVRDFKDQTLLNPRIKNAVGHISLSFSPKDADRLTDPVMAQIAREYMERMGIRNTQFLIVRHTDQAHPHCHIVYNRVGNNGQTISDKNIKIRNSKVCKELTAKYGLYYPRGKEQVRRERLREPDKTKYAIYDAIRGCLPGCKSWGDLEKRLQERGLTTTFKLRRGGRCNFTAGRVLRLNRPGTNAAADRRIPRRTRSPRYGFDPAGNRSDAGRAGRAKPQNPGTTN